MHIDIKKDHKKIYKTFVYTGVFVSFVCLAIITQTLAAPDSELTYHGKLTDTSNVAVADGNYDFTISIYDAPTGGNRLWTARGTVGSPTSKSVSVQNGIFSTTLGESGDNALDIDFDENYYLGVTIGTNSEMTPRRKITPTGFALNAHRLNGLTADNYIDTSSTAQTKSGALAINGNFTVNADDLFVNTSNGRIGIGTTAPNAQLHVKDGDVHITATDDYPVLKLQGFGTSLYTPHIIGNAARGTESSPSATLSGDTLFALRAVGYGTTNFAAANTGSAQILFLAEENFTDTTAAASIQFHTKPSGTGAAAARMTILGSGNVGIGTNAPSAKLHTIATTEQLRLGYDTSNYLSTTVGSTGGITFNAVGTGQSFTFSDPISLTGNLTITGHILPATDDTYDLGSSTNRFRDLYLGPNSLHIGEDGDEGVISYDTTNDVFNFDKAAVFGTTVSDIEGAIRYSGTDFEGYDGTQWVSLTVPELTGTNLDDVFSTNGILRRTAAGTYSTVTDNSTNWNTAYGWGDHSTEGYLTANQTITLTGDVTGTGTTSIVTTIGANSVALGTDTTGNYVSSNTAGTGISITGTAGEGWSPTIAVTGVLEDLNTLGAPTTADQFIVATGAGVFAYESGATVRTSLGLGSLATLSTITTSNITNGTIAAADLNLTDITLTDFTNDAGFITSADDTVSGTELDGVFSTTGLLTRTAVGTYSTITDNSTNWNTAYTNRITSATAPLSITSNVISMTQANTSTAGYLSAADWNTFNGKFTLPSLTSGSVIFSNGTTLTQDNANFFWDDSTNRLGIGTTSPSAKLHTFGTTEQLRLGYDTSNYFSTTIGSTGNVTFDAVGTGQGFAFQDGLTVTGHVLPSADDTYDLGSSTNRFRDLYLGPNSLHIGEDGDEVVISYNTLTDSVEFSKPTNITGSIQLTNDTSTCDSAKEGAMRYNDTTKVMEFCNGTDWGTLGSGGTSVSGGTGYLYNHTFTTAESWSPITGFSNIDAVPVWVDTRNVSKGRLEMIEDGDIVEYIDSKSVATRVLAPSTSLSIRSVAVGYDVSTATYTDAFSVTTQDASPEGVAFNNDGTKMFIVGSANDRVYEYTLSTAFDTSSATYVQNFSVSGQDTAPQGITFNNDGTKMYIVGNTGDDVNEYALSTAFDISTASYTSRYSVSSQDLAPLGITFNNDGTKMFITGNDGDDINEYVLSTAFDITSADYVQRFGVAAEETAPEGIVFSPGGKKMFIVGSGGDEINEYILNVPFDISTASFVEVFSVAVQDGAPSGIAFNDDGTKMFIVGAGNDSVYEYAMTGTFSGTANAAAGGSDGSSSSVASGGQTWQLMHVQDQKTSGTAGGSSSAGDNTRTLNTVVTNEITGASLASNQVTLPAGKYYIEVDSAANMSIGVARSYVLVNGTKTIIGPTVFSNNNINTFTTTASGNVTLTNSSTISVVTYTGQAVSTNGLGVPTNQSPHEVYTDLRIWKIEDSSSGSSLPTCTDGQTLSYNETFSQWECADGVGGSGGWTSVNQQVFSGNAPTSWTDLDMNSIVGASVSFVMLKIENNSGSGVGYYMRTNGETATTSKVSGTGAGTVNGGQFNYFTVETDASGIIEWYADVSASSTVDVVGYIGAGSSNTSLWAQSGSNIYYNSGNVGIGTTEPLSALHVGALYTTATAAQQNGVTFNAQYNIADTGLKVGMAAVSKTAHTTGTIDSIVGSISRGVKDGIGNVTNAYGLYTRVDNLNATGTITNAYGLFIADSEETGVITNDYGLYQVDTGALNYFAGNVGIGTSSPSSSLHINGGSLTISNNTTNTDGIIFRERSTGYSPHISFYDDALNKVAAIGKTHTDGIGFYTNTISGGSEKMFIAYDGNVGIGITNPSQRLTVYNGSTTGTYTTTGWIHSSDERLKTNINPIDDPLQKVMQLNDVYFNWNADPDNNRQIGFIAQDVQKIIPEVVVGNEQDGYGIAYGNLTVLLTGAIQEQNTLITKNTSDLTLKAEANTVSQLQDLVDDELTTVSDILSAVQTDILTVQTEVQANKTALAEIQDRMDAVDAGLGILEVLGATDLTKLELLLAVDPERLVYMDGDATLDDLTVIGSISAGSIAVGAFTVTNDPDAPIVGTGVIEQDTQSVDIATEAVKADSHIFTSLRGSESYVLRVEDIEDGVGFTVSADSEATEDIFFDWFIVGEEQKEELPIDEGEEVAQE